MFAAILAVALTSQCATAQGAQCAVQTRAVFLQAPVVQYQILAAPAYTETYSETVTTTRTYGARRHLFPLFPRLRYRLGSGCG